MNVECHSSRRDAALEKYPQPQSEWGLKLGDRRHTMCRWCASIAVLNSIG